MTDAFINQVTLDCLLNKQQYEKYINKTISKSVDKKDKKFYKKRILNLTKDFFTSDDNLQNMLPEVKYAFDNYVKACIHSFKVIDNNDIIQSEYDTINKIEIEESIEENEAFIEENNDYIEENNGYIEKENDDYVEKGENEYDNTNDIIKVKKTQKEVNSLFARSTVKIINPTLDNFIKFKTPQMKEDIILPKQKDINLNESSLKNKGIVKKKNIGNIYEDETKK
jgi:hypothetical protein